MIQMIQKQPIHSHPQKKVKIFKSIFMEKTQWSLHSGKWGRLQAKHSFISELQMHPKSIQLYGNKEPQLVRYIIMPQYTLLKHLNLKNNKINTINTLCRLQAPMIEELLLGDNFITNTKEIVKLNCPQLKVLSLYANRVCDIQHFYKANFKQMEIIILGLNCISSFEAINKCEWPLIKKISFECNRRVGGVSHKMTKWMEKPDVLFG